MARRLHPDAAGPTAADEMAALNEAWRVLNDPGRRARYDATLRPQSTPAPDRNDDRYRVPADAFEGRPGGLPWGWLTMIGVLLSVFVFTSTAMRSDPAEPVTDGVLFPGSCVTIEPNGDAGEVPCSEPHDAVVQQLVPIDTACPIDTDEHRDRQGLGKVCVEPA